MVQLAQDGIERGHLVTADPTVGNRDREQHPLVLDEFDERGIPDRLDDGVDGRVSLRPSGGRRPADEVTDHPLQVQLTPQQGVSRAPRRPGFIDRRHHAAQLAEALSQVRVAGRADRPRQECRRPPALGPRQHLPRSAAVTQAEVEAEGDEGRPRGGDGGPQVCRAQLGLVVVDELSADPQGCERSGAAAFGDAKEGFGMPGPNA